MRKRKQATPPILEREPWHYVIEPLSGFPGARYRIYLLSGFMRFGGGDTGWGWTAITYAGARRKAARELHRKQVKERTLELRAAWMAGGPSIAELKSRLRVLNHRLDPYRTAPIVFAADVIERAQLRELLGPLVPQPERRPEISEPRRGPIGGSGASDAN